MTSSNYNDYDLDALWAMVEHEKETPNWWQHDAWDRAARLCENQATNLAKALTELQQHWPAHPGSASEAFGAVVAQVVEAMRRTAEESRANQEAIRSITVDIGGAQILVLSLLQERAKYQAAEQSMSQGAPAQPPPVNWRQQLTDEAREIMWRMDDKVSQQVPIIRTNRVTPPMDPLSSGTGPGQTTGVAQAQGTPVQHFPLPRVYPPPIAALPPADPPPATSPSGSLWDDPVLDGSPAPPPLLPSPPSAGPALDPGVIGGRPGAWAPGVPPGALPGVIPGALPGLRPGTVAGGLPGAAPGTASAAGAGPGGRAGAASPSLVGGAPVTPSSRAGATRSGVSPAGRVPGFRDRKRRRDPGDPWAVEEGTSPVLEPTYDDPDTSPGPGVLGLDR